MSLHRFLDLVNKKTQIVNKYLRDEIIV